MDSKGDDGNGVVVVWLGKLTCCHDIVHGIVPGWATLSVCLLELCFVESGQAL